MRLGVMIGVLGIAAAMLVACSGGGEHPPSADFAGVVTPPPPSKNPDASTTEPANDAGADEIDDHCPPRSKRECMTAFKTINGKVQSCTQSFQWCRGDGKGWYGCGFSVDKPPD